MSIITGNASSISEEPAYVEQLSYFCLAKEHVPIAGISIGENRASSAALGQMWGKRRVIKHTCKISSQHSESVKFSGLLIFISHSVSVEGISTRTAHLDGHWDFVFPEACVAPPASLPCLTE